MAKTTEKVTDEKQISETQIKEVMIGWNLSREDAIIKLQDAPVKK